VVEPKGGGGWEGYVVVTGAVESSGGRASQVRPEPRKRLTRPEPGSGGAAGANVASASSAAEGPDRSPRNRSDHRADTVCRRVYNKNVNVVAFLPVVTD